jgi:hypothetical protein
LPEPTLDSSELEEALAFIRQKKEGLLPGRIERGWRTSMALPEPILDSSELAEALAYIRQKKEGLLPGRIEGVWPDIHGLVGVHFKLSIELRRRPLLMEKDDETSA